VLIAAHAIAADAVLVTNNTKDFKGIAGLVVENWVTGDNSIPARIFLKVSLGCLVFSFRCFPCLALSPCGIPSFSAACLHFLPCPTKVPEPLSPRFSLRKI
jgi:hypothetical protein